VSKYKNLDKFIEKKGKNPNTKNVKIKEKELTDKNIKELTLKRLKEFGYIE